MVEGEDVTDSSDELDDFYQGDKKMIYEQLTTELNEFTKKPLTKLDRTLLKGFYTNDRNELENVLLVNKFTDPIIVEPVLVQPDA